MTILSMLSVTVPILLVWLVAIGLAAVNYSRHPQPARLSLIGAVVLIIGGCAGSISQVLIVQYGFTALDVDTASTAMSFSSIVWNCISAIGVLLFAGAAWVGRASEGEG